VCPIQALGKCLPERIRGAKKSSMVEERMIDIRRWIMAGDEDGQIFGRGEQVRRVRNAAEDARIFVLHFALVILGEGGAIVGRRREWSPSKAGAGLKSGVSICPAYRRISRWQNKSRDSSARRFEDDAKNDESDGRCIRRAYRGRKQAGVLKAARRSLHESLARRKSFFVGRQAGAVCEQPA